MPIMAYKVGAISSIVTSARTRASLATPADEQRGIPVVDEERHRHIAGSKAVV